MARRLKEQAPRPLPASLCLPCTADQATALREIRIPPICLNPDSSVHLASAPGGQAWQQLQQDAGSGGGGDESSSSGGDEGSSSSGGAGAAGVGSYGSIVWVSASETAFARVSVHRDAGSVEERAHNSGGTSDAAAAPAATARRRLDVEFSATLNPAQ